MAGHTDEVIFALLKLFLLRNICKHTDRALHLSLCVNNGLGAHQYPMPLAGYPILILDEGLRFFAVQRFNDGALFNGQRSAPFITGRNPAEHLAQ